MSDRLKCRIEIDHAPIPEGWKPKRFGLPVVGEHYIHLGGRAILAGKNHTCEPRLIVTPSQGRGEPI